MTNAIVAENLNRTSTETWEELGLNPGGDPRDVWDAGSSNQIEGFATDISVNHGTTVEFKINVNANPGEDVPYHIEIYRLGYYGGDGARLVYSSGTLIGNTQPDAIMDQDTGMVSATNWNVSTDWDVPADATSGVYLVKLVREDNGATNQIPFIVRDDDGPKSDIILQTSDTTWHAYNGWGGNNGEIAGNFYGDPSGQIDHEDVADPGLGAQDRAYAVSYDRPFITRDGGGAAAGPQDYLFGADYAAIYFLEKNGYDVSYISGVDTDRLGADYLIGHKAFISVGHDEYWSGQQRFNVEEARDNGVNLLFWSGNEVYWKTRLEPSSDGTEYRTLVCYKETWANRDPGAGPEDYANIDPANDWTGTWRDLRFVDAVDELGNLIAGGSRLDPHSLSHPLSGSDPNCNCVTGAGPENSMTGQLFGPDGTGQPGATMDVAGALAGLRVWRDTTVATTGELHVPGILGYEWNTSPDDEHRPDGMIHLSESVDVPWNSILIDQGNHVQPGVATHNLSLYRADSGALVFGAGTVFWSWGLSDEHDNSHIGAAETLALKQFTLNMFADMGIQPGVADAILASQGLVRATMSTDNVAPTTTVSIVGNPIEVTEGDLITIHGTATDDDGNPLTDDGVVAAIEVSTDGGATWHPAEGTTNWTYSWRAQGPGNHTIKARAIDDSVNLQATNVQSTELTVMASPESRLFTDDDPVTENAQTFSEGSELELGVKFFSTSNGFITNVMFYKSPLETETEHEGHLWSLDGTPIVTFTFENETASGWQTVELDTPIAITASTTYIVSYHSFGDYYASNGYFNTADHVSGSLTAPSTVNAGGNGVFAAGGAFPNQSFGGSNYWVDVTFTLFTGTNEAPVIDGGAIATFGIAENISTVTTVVATDPNAGQSPVYGIILPDGLNGAGADGALFTINPSTGELSFISPPDFESPIDSDGNNSYQVTVRAADSFEPGTMFDDQLITVNVTDQVELGGFDGKLVLAEYIFGATSTTLFPSAGASQTATVSGSVEFANLPFAGNPDPGNGDFGLAAVDIGTTTILVQFPLDTDVFGQNGSVNFANPGTHPFNGVKITDTASSLPVILGATIIDQAGFGVALTGIDITITADSIFVNAANAGSRQIDVDAGTAGAQPSYVLLSIDFNDAPEITSDGGAATATIQGQDGTTLVTTLTAVDADTAPAPQTLTFSIIGGEDQALFQILNGDELHFITAPNFASPPPTGATPGYQVRVQVSDGAGGTDTQLITVNLDTDADVGDDAAVSISEAVINASEAGTVEYTISGVDADATAEVTFTSSGGGTPVVVSGLGNGTTNVNLSSLPDGTISASIVVTDNSSNTASGAGDVATLDTLIATPTVALTNDSGSNGSDLLTNNAALNLSSVAPDVTRSFIVDGGAPSASYTAPTGQGSHTVQVIDTDTAGNTANASITFTLDTLIATPTVALTNDSGSNGSDLLTNNAALNLSSVAPDVTRSFIVDGGAPSASYTAPTGQGSHTVQVIDTDTAGNTANASITFTLDTLIATPTVALTNDSGSNGSDLLTNNAALNLSSVAPDVTRSFIVDGGAPSASYTAPTGQGSHTVQVIDTDTAGNTANASITFTLDTLIATPTVALTNDSGSNGSDLLTNNAALNLSSVAPDVTRSFIVDGGAPSASYTAPTGQGSHTVQVIDTDTAGNTANASITFTLDTGIPNAPTIVLAEDNVGPDTGNLSSGDTTDDNVPVLRVRLVGTNAVAGDSVRIFNGATTVITAAISANDVNNGYVSVTLPSLIDNTYSFSAKVIDAAGNTSDSSATFTVNVEADTGEPPTDILLSNSSVTENAANALVGTLSAVDPDAGDSFTFTLLDDAGGRFALDGASLRTTGGLDFEDGEFVSITLQVTDASNNSIQETIQIQVGNVDGVNIRGSQGNDVISTAKSVTGQPKATGEEDTILGRGGNDNINGAGGDDTIRGGGGNDKITGGLGVDQLFGNAGADRFIFKAVADSVAADADTITGFSHSQGDKIDLRGLEAGAPGLQLSFIGGATFGSQAGQVRYDAGLDLVQVDTDGNGVADFAIHVTANLVRSDFIL